MTDTNPGGEATVDVMAEALAARLAKLKEDRSTARAQRTALVALLKVLDTEIDKGERMLKAMVPRTRSSSAAPSGGGS